MQRQFYLPLIILQFYALTINAQNNELDAALRTADSLQRLQLKTMLDLKDSQVDEIYFFRNELKVKNRLLREDGNLSEEELKKAITKARGETANRLKELLGTNKYKAYRQIVDKRLVKSKSSYREK